MPRPDKVKKVEELTEYLKQAQAVYVFEITGVSANDMTALRKKVKTANSKMLLKVSKNTLFRIALKNAGYPESDVADTGQNCFGFAFEDPVELAKIIADFAKEFDGVKIRGGYLEKKPIGADEVKRLASIPPRDVLLSQVVGGVKAPLYGLVMAVSGPIRKLCYALKAIEEKKQAA